MLKAKDTNSLSEISSFFKNNDASKAMNNMMYMISSLNMIEHTLFGRSTRFNSKYSLLQILTCLILTQNAMGPIPMWKRGQSLFPR